VEAAVPSTYPVNVEFEYREPLNRLTTFFRLFTIIPIAIVYGLLSQVVVISTLLMLVFREKYPGWWFDYNRAYAGFSLRVESYALLLTDRYPATDDSQGVTLELPPPPADLNRWLPLVKWLLLIPHYIVLAFLAIGALFAVVFAWFAILFTGRYPRALFDYVSGVLRWGLRVAAYGFLLTTDQYPPFRLSP
jgi:hypothetical protein